MFERGIDWRAGLAAFKAGQIFPVYQLYNQWRWESGLFLRSTCISQGWLPPDDVQVAFRQA